VGRQVRSPCGNSITWGGCGYSQLWTLTQSPITSKREQNAFSQIRILFFIPYRIIASEFERAAMLA
jgi:hypothetical protein